jgi:hypothetical protein
VQLPNEPQWKVLWLEGRAPTPRGLSPDEGDRLALAIIDTREGYRELFEFARSSGKRKRECYTLDCEHVKWDAGVMIRGKPYRYIKSKHHPMTKDGIRRVWNDVRARAGLIGPARFRFHDLHHDLGTKVLRDTGNLKLTAELLDHADVATVSKTYAHVTQADKAAALERLAQSRRPTTAPAGAHPKRTSDRDQHTLGDLGCLGGGFDLSLGRRSPASLSSSSLRAHSAARRSLLGGAARAPPSVREDAIAAGHRGGEGRDEGKDHHFGPQITSDASDVRHGREEGGVVLQCSAPANNLYGRNDREQRDRDESRDLGPKGSVGLVIGPALCGIDRAREPDHENRQRENPVPIVDARNAQNVFAFHVWANGADLECQNPGKQEDQEVVRYGEGEICRREIKHRQSSI